MPLIATALTTICLSVSAPGQYGEACNKGLEAGARQTGAYQVLEDEERKTILHTEETVGKTTTHAAIGGVFLYRAYKTKSIAFKMPKTDVADYILNEVTPNSYRVNLGWHF